VFKAPFLPKSSINEAAATRKMIDVMNFPKGGNEQNKQNTNRE
jgi:hypothetical protein